MGTEEVHNRTRWNGILLVYRETAVEARESDPPMVELKRDRGTDRRVAVDIVALVHEAVAASWTTNLHRKDPLIGLDIHMIEAHTGLVEDLFDLTSGHVGEIVAVHYDDGTESAGSQAVDGFKSDLLVGGGLPGPDAQLDLNLIGDRLSVADVAGRAQTDGKKMLSSGLETEGPKESRYPVDIYERMACLLRNDAECLLREVTVPCLNVFEDGDQAPPALSMAVYDLFDLLAIHRCPSRRKRTTQRG
jgi:hypothetical protein